MLPLALTMGDPAGIGPDITLKAWLRHQKTKFSAPLPSFFVIADPALLRTRANALNIDVPVEEVSSGKGASDVFDDALPVMPLELTAPVKVGTSSPEHAVAVVESIGLAVDMVANGNASGMVTNPISKATLYAKAFKYPGHTEFLSELAASRWPDQPRRSVMMLADGDQLRVVPLTIHIPLVDVPKAITVEKIEAVVHTTCAALRKDFGINEPRIAVTGLNPHAGESGGLGREEIDVIIPALEKLRKQGLKISGPHPADTMFHEAARKTYDVAIAMYHDQALIPLKTLAFDHGVNITLGLPFVRTSPDHGTALDIAGTGKAKPDSLIASLKMAARMISHRNGKMS